MGTHQERDSATSAHGRRCFVGCPLQVSLPVDAVRSMPLSCALATLPLGLPVNLSPLLLSTRRVLRRIAPTVPPMQHARIASNWAASCKARKRS